MIANTNLYLVSPFEGSQEDYSHSDGFSLPWKKWDSIKEGKTDSTATPLLIPCLALKLLNTSQKVRGQNVTFSNPSVPAQLIQDYRKSRKGSAKPRQNKILSPWMILNFSHQVQGVLCVRFIHRDWICIHITVFKQQMSSSAGLLHARII